MKRGKGRVIGSEERLENRKWLREGKGLYIRREWVGGIRKRKKRNY